MASRTFHTPYNQVFNTCIKALNDLEFEITEKSKQNGKIHAKTGTSLLSWGEEIDISVEVVAKSQTKVTVNSETVAQLFSWGKNNSNIEEIMNTLISYLK